MSRSVGWIIGVFLLVAVAGLQINQMRQFRTELASLRTEIRGQQADDLQPAAVSSGPAMQDRDRTAGLHARLANLERSVAGLAKAAEGLMDRGVVPPSEDRLAHLQQRFFDPSVSERDRLSALRLLRRNQQMNDEVVTHAMSLLQTSTNGNTRRALLQELDGVTNAALKQPLVAMLESETSGNVREELVDVLSSFAADPAVEKKLWQLAMNDPDGDVREEAAEALTDGPATPERIQSLREKAANPDASLDERLLSLRALREANAPAPEIISEMASLAQNSTDPLTRAKLFRAFDGINDPSLMAPLVNGLQDPNPVVRENAADALSSFSSDPRIQEWLNHVIQNDVDPRVKREAHSALAESQGRNRRGR